MSLGLAFLYFTSADIAVLNPKGEIAAKQRKLLVDATYLMLIVVIPVYLMTFYFMWKYHHENRKADYAPEWDFNLMAEVIWWSIPFVIIIVLSVMTWKSSHELDPYKALVERGKKPLKIQVVALQWKWLFIYPEQNIATVNFIQIPENTPINFDITADAPMNSFWIPQLGGQIYAMPGMKTKLHLIAREKGLYRGSSANISGTGFASMVFTTKVTSEEDFETWVTKVQQSNKSLTHDEYNRLVKPSEHDAVSYYTLGKANLYEDIVMKYMMPMPEPQGAK